MRRLLSLLVCLLVGCCTLMASTPRRIVSLAPSLTRSLYYLDAADRIVGCTSYCMAAGRKGVTVIASAVKTSPEAIVALKPDLILATSLTRQSDIETLRKLGLEVVTYRTGTTLVEICDQFVDLGKRIGKGAEAKKLAEASLVVAQDLKQRMSTQGLTGRTVLMQLGDNPLYGVTGGNYMGEMITQLGCINICEDLSHGTLSREYVLRSDPDYIFVVGMGEERQPMIKGWQSFPDLKAARQGHLYELEANETSQPTPITYVLTLRKMAHDLGLKE
ncbi:ABC transporter substrate-binding protein [uncultured Porphyromonas sp.]|uniref:ABC transporter substrate-binding protein n=1 Tax=uncultured Porphyromonas sp. TaxID=159274 RepID=UPI00262EAD94|nr:helical backbone metal receptor [uncultured Porphyromonas sp.]